MNKSSTFYKYYSIRVLLLEAESMMYRARSKELRKFDLTSEQAGALFVIQAIGDKATPAEISRWLLRRPHTISSLLNRMKKKGLINMVHDSHRKNIQRITLTAKGKQSYYHSIRSGSIQKILSFLSEEQYQQLRSLLKEILRRSQKELRAARVEYCASYTENNQAD
jgi:DNA-binding MarR family transcriptional regulator